MKYKFNLERALKGDELITRDEQEVSGFMINPKIVSVDYPYFISSIKSTYTKDGIQYMGCKNDNDLFMKYPEMKEGMKILVKEDDNWEERIFLFKDKRDRVVTVSRKFENAYLKGEYYRMALWKQWELIEEPAIEIQVKINGKEGKLSDISTETFEKLKRLEL